MFYNVTPTPHPNLQVKSMLPVILWPPVCWAYHHTVLCLAFVLVFPTVNEETSCSSERPSGSPLCMRYHAEHRVKEIDETPGLPSRDL